jgi:hypothetical protein
MGGITEVDFADLSSLSTESDFGLRGAGIGIYIGIAKADWAGFYFSIFSVLFSRIFIFLVLLKHVCVSS